MSDINPVNEQLSARMLLANQKLGADKYGVNNHPLVSALQSAKPRCVATCRCDGCNMWRRLALAIFHHLEIDNPENPIERV